MDLHIANKNYTVNYSPMVKIYDGKKAYAIMISLKIHSIETWSFVLKKLYKHVWKVRPAYIKN